MQIRNNKFVETEKEDERFSSIHLLLFVYKQTFDVAAEASVTKLG